MSLDENMDTAIQMDSDTKSSPETPTCSSPFAFAEYAGLLSLFSMLILIDGSVRLNAVDVKMLTLPSTVTAFPPVVLFISAIAELLFGLLGLVLGLFSLMSRSFEKWLCTVTMWCQVVLSIFVFVVNNLADPIYRIKHIIPNVKRPITSVSLFRGAESMALLTGVHFTLALFVGQLIFMKRLETSRKNQKVHNTFPGDRSNAVAWNMNLALAGFWTLALGSGVLSHQEHFPSTPDVSGTPFSFRPHVGTEPGFTIATGIIMILWGAIGITLTFKLFRTVRYFMFGSLVVAILVYLNFTLVQLGQVRIGARGGGLIASNTILVFVTFFMSSYFLHRARAKTGAIG